MITPLRRRHQRMWLVLAILLPVVLVVAWRVRRPATLMETLPPELVETVEEVRR